MIESEEMEVREMTVTVHGNYDRDKTTTIRVTEMTVTRGQISKRAWMAAIKRARLIGGDYLRADRGYLAQHDNIRVYDDRGNEVTQIG